MKYSYAIKNKIWQFEKLQNIMVLYENYIICTIDKSYKSSAR